MGKGSLIILSGPSGVGKGTVRQKLEDLGGVSFYYSVSMTTRSPRPGEVDGRDYFFVTREEFEKRVKDGKFLEWAEFVGNCYGTPKDVVDSYREKGIDVLLEIETNGAEQVMAKCPDAVSIFIVPPSFEALESRIRGRSTEDEATIQRRLGKARSELEKASQYKYVVLNDSVERAAKEIADIISASHR
ncbi:MAG: guanylate kinase [Erysipelotrichaceae bacterium]|nr:guanylate kinase [Erysipelotrichaceae bacterium]